MMRKDRRAGKQWDGLSNRAFRISSHQVGDKMRGFIAPDFVYANEMHVTD